MARVRVDLAERSYDIQIQTGALAQAGALVKEALPRAARALVISDSNVAPLFGSPLRRSLAEAGIAAAEAVIPAGEASKTLEQAVSLYSACVDAGLERSSVIVALGGGVVGDLAGFVAATYLRGVPFVQVPTTLLAQVDSSVGGKTGVDLPQGKNLVGAFHQPSLVLADPACLATLPRREVTAGMAEVLKHAVIQNAAFLDFLEYNADRILDLEPGIMEQVVEANCRIKAHVVSADEKEGGLRAILNFGHTLGHALEAAMGYGTWLHGECVAVGMVAATRIARERGVLRDASLLGRLENLLVRLGLPVRLPPEVAMEQLAPLMQRDKKVEAGQVRWVLPVRAGEAVVSADVPAATVKNAVASLRG